MPSTNIITPPAIPTPTNWEEVEQAFAALQRWTNDLTTELNQFRAVLSLQQTATIPQLITGTIPYTAVHFIDEGAAVWTVQSGDVERFEYVRIGPLVLVNFRLVATTITTDTSGSLYIRLNDFDVVDSNHQIADEINAPFVVGGMLEWSDDQAGTFGIGRVAVLGENFNTANKTILLQLDRCIGNSADASLFAAWPISNQLDISGSVAWLTSTANIPGQ
jgi:hypothetical protein